MYPLQFVAGQGDGVRDEASFFVKDADFHGLLSAALHLPPDSGHEHGPSADGLAVVILVLEAQVEVPPVIEERELG